jgi:hypothetical protein
MSSTVSAHNIGFAGRTFASLASRAIIFGRIEKAIALDRPKALQIGL